ncbi:hypothetical protein Bca101_059062 [Brassica carinata]
MMQATTNANRFQNSCLNSPPGRIVATSSVSALAFSIDFNLMFLLILLTETSAGASGDRSTNRCLTDLGFGPLIYFYSIPKDLERSYDPANHSSSLYLAFLNEIINCSAIHGVLFVLLNPWSTNTTEKGSKMEQVRLGCGSVTAHLSLTGYDPRDYNQGRSATFESVGSGLAMSPGDTDLKEKDYIFVHRFSRLHFNFSSAPLSFTKQIHGPTKDKQAEMFLHLLCHSATLYLHVPRHS